MMVSDKELEKYDDLGDFTSLPKLGFGYKLWCELCRVKWLGSVQSKACPQCGSSVTYDSMFPRVGDDDGERPTL